MTLKLTIGQFELTKIVVLRYRLCYLPGAFQIAWKDDHIAWAEGHRILDVRYRCANLNYQTGLSLGMACVRLGDFKTAKQSYQKALFLCGKTI